MLEAVKKGGSLKNASEGLKADRFVVMEAALHDHQQILYASQEFQDD